MRLPPDGTRVAQPAVGSRDWAGVRLPGPPHHVIGIRLLEAFLFVLLFCMHASPRRSFDDVFLTDTDLPVYDCLVLSSPSRGSGRGRAGQSASGTRRSHGTHEGVVRHVSTPSRMFLLLLLLRLLLLLPLRLRCR